MLYVNTLWTEQYKQRTSDSVAAINQEKENGLSMAVMRVVPVAREP